STTVLAVNTFRQRVVERAVKRGKIIAMVIIRFKVRCQPGKSDALVAAFKEVIAASRPLKGVISFDIGRDLSDPDAFIATEVFEDNDAMARQGALAEVKKTMGVLGGVVAGPPEATLYEVS